MKNVGINGKFIIPFMDIKDKMGCSHENAGEITNLDKKLEGDP